MTTNNAFSFRELVKLPTMPSEGKDFSRIPMIKMPKSEMQGKDLIFEKSNGFEQALKLGFFLIKIPKEINLKWGDFLVKNFYKDKSSNPQAEKFCGFKKISIEQDYQGYFDREFDQWENFYIESSNWRKFLPEELNNLGLQMSSFGVDILRNFLSYLDVPQNIWSKITGGLTDLKGHHMLAFNHFRSDKPTRGTKFHRDSGWITVLRSWDPGLVALINKKIYAINPEEDYFIINFGSSIEVLTQNLPSPARGNIHGVIRTVRNNQEEDRYSYVIFLDSNLKDNIYMLDDQKKPIFVQTVADFAIQEVSRTYDENNTEL